MPEELGCNGGSEWGGVRRRAGARWFTVSLLFIASSAVVGTLIFLVGLDPLGDDRLVVAGAYLVSFSGVVCIVTAAVLVFGLVRRWWVARG